MAYNPTLRKPDIKIYEDRYLRYSELYKKYIHEMIIVKRLCKQKNFPDIIVNIIQKYLYIYYDSYFQ